MYLSNEAVLKSIVSKMGVVLYHNASFNTEEEVPLQPNVQTEYIDGQVVADCWHHGIYAVDEGYMCPSCRKYWPAKVKGVKVYTYLDSVGYTTDEDGLADNNYLDWYTDDVPNPELKYVGFKRKISDPEFYDTYEGLLPEMVEDPCLKGAVMFKEDFSDDDNENFSSDDEYLEEVTPLNAVVGDESRTHKTMEQLRFWRDILWSIKCNAKLAKSKAKKAFLDGIITFEERLYVNTMVTNLDKVSLERKEKWDVFQAIKNIRITNVYSKPSTKMKGKLVWFIEYSLYGSKGIIYKGDWATNWLCPKFKGKEMPSELVSAIHAKGQGWYVSGK